ncbi:Receptor-type guanylate cyclase gcy [Seminavis robusta]|uniref:Receptor-type guanylate cyclase gcy n=1 Tax=Seminavis robusta TaxID=568900 RepID=A0A9N8DUJ0_9STRA|nr:Receptor-type guanylate cyclase gcy [Seminavis robusta]|eukprot:Sro353_g124450.1 Receptor-type guanylate cyclase gcy (1524) ;mRNA; f:21239-26520
MMKVLLYTLACLALLLVPGVRATNVPCTDNAWCIDNLHHSSECVDGFCSNPFYQKGCLAQRVPNWHRVRTCNSEDPPDAVAKGYCQVSAFDYPEIRIHAQNWESSFFGTWILTILLSELLDVPVSVEAGVVDTHVHLYDMMSRIEYGSNADWGGTMRNALATNGDCRPYANTGSSDNPEEYQPCSHVMPETWIGALGRAGDVFETGVAEKPMALGALGGDYWYVPKFTGARYPEFLSYVGLQGDEARKKLADIFKRPATWKDYCDEVSESNCQEDDGVATRPPETEDEEMAMFAEGEYTGHFRKTDANDCVKYPHNCTGHFADYPCGWTTPAQQQAYHLDIGLEVVTTYTYSQLVQIWAAANATQSDVMVFWWEPDSMPQLYYGTDAQHTRVSLPQPTQTCYDNRANAADRCGDDYEKRIGSPLGDCDTAPQSLKKVVSTTVRDMSQNPEIPEELWSPAFEAISAYEISTLQLQDIFELWYGKNLDRWGYDPRDAVCEWIVDNLELVQSFAPPTHPRKIQEAPAESLALAAQGLSYFMMAVLVVTMGLTWLWRSKATICIAQLECILILEIGLFLVAGAALASAISPSDASCQAVPWLANIGYCLVLIPTVARVDAIIRLSAAGKHMQHLRLSQKVLFGTVGLGVLVAATYCVIWTVVDPRSIAFQYQVLGEENEFGENLVKETDYCSSESLAWYAISVAWPGCLILFGLIVNFMNSRAPDGINDTKVLSALLISHFIFVVLRVLVLNLNGAVNATRLADYSSLVLLGDCAATLMIFVFPKVLGKSGAYDTKDPLPDIFLSSSIMNAEIVGFAGWSSVREPVQIFKFLERMWCEFDSIAKKHSVFKVDSGSDTYVAATGIPRKQSDHAEKLALFGAECLARFYELAQELEVQFGPDTSDLELRIGIHSGKVTGGYLQGMSTRFNLFGETCNTANDMGASSEAGRIQVSEYTARLLTNAGKKHWLAQRDGSVSSRVGQSEVTTYWCRPDNHRENQNLSPTAEADLERGTIGGLRNITNEKSAAEKRRRLVEWNVQVLLNLLKEVVRSKQHQAAVRKQKSRAQGTLLSSASIVSSPMTSSKADSSDDSSCDLTRPLDGVKEVVDFPEFSRRKARLQKGRSTVFIPQVVVDQLHEYVTCISDLYKDNPFHSFDHASHVVMATLKYTNRIISASELQEDNDDAMSSGNGPTAAQVHDHTYGISSDPLTHFSFVFSALIHDVDHPGVPNQQFCKEDPELANLYFQRSLAEQNSFDLSWNLLQESRFSDLRKCLFANRGEQKRFRQLVINQVMATDLGDLELKNLRQGRWEKAFAAQDYPGDQKIDSIVQQVESRNRKATIVIEHLIQASDVSHTMQHWEIYREWNEKLFMEMYAAHRNGRASKDPSDFWYEGELGFFDFYVVPLSKKLNECGVFGISCDENLSYASSNRDLWVKRGKQATEEMRKKAEALWGNSGSSKIDVVQAAPEAYKDDTTTAEMEGSGWGISGSSKLEVLQVEPEAFKEVEPEPFRDDDATTTPEGHMECSGWL